MNNLPAEILHTIFNLLHQHDKLECMTVCQHWAITIESFSLYHSVRISDMNQMQKLVARIQQEPSLGAKVEQLILEVDPDSNFEMDNLPVYLPNVRSFFFINVMGQNGDYYRLFTESLAPQHPWYQNIEHLTEYSSGLHTQSILSSGTCPFLKTIMVSASDFDLGSEFIQLLGNAPALTTLCMMYASLTITDLEFLHNVAPHLRSLTLSYCHLGVGDVSTLRYLNVIPATCMKKLYIKLPSEASSFEMDILLLQYINKKYINLSEFSYDVPYANYPEVNLKRFYNEGFAPLMKSWGSQLEKLSLAYQYRDENIFELLDNCGSTIKRLKLGRSIKFPVLERLVQSNQAQFIQSLTIMYISESQSLKCLEALVSLKELILYSPNQQLVEICKVIKLDELLEFVGHRLETLQIDARNLIIALNNTSPSYPLLKSLTLEHTLIPAYFDKFISQSLPQLKKLTLKTCDFTQKRQFVLPNIDLTRFEMRQTSPRLMSVNMVITTLNNGGEERFYTAKSTYPSNRPGFEDEIIYPATKSKVYNETVMRRPRFKLVCNSVLHVFMVDNRT